VLVDNVRLARAAINTCRVVLEIYIGTAQHSFINWKSDDLSSEDYKKICDHVLLRVEIVCFKLWNATSFDASL
jgi:hypothetical protein